MKLGNQSRPSPFPGRMSYEATKPGFSFFVFILCSSTFLLIGEYALGLSIPSQEIGVANISEMTFFVLSGT